MLPIEQTRPGCSWLEPCETRIRLYTSECCRHTLDDPLRRILIGILIGINYLPSNGTDTPILPPVLPPVLPPTPPPTPTSPGVPARRYLPPQLL